MANSTAVTLEHYLVRSQSKHIQSLAHTTLRKFSTDKLIELKLTNKNFQSGFDFSEMYYQDSELSRLVKIIVRNFEKSIPWLGQVNQFGESLVYKNSFLSLTNGRVVITTTRDPVVIKLVRKINIELRSLQIPIILAEASSQEYRYSPNFPRDNPISDDGSMNPFRFIFITVGHRTHRESFSYTNIYKLLFKIPQIMSMLKVIHRKAMFNELRIRESNRSYSFKKLLAGQPIRSRSNNIQS